MAKQPLPSMNREYPPVWVVILDYNTGPILLDCVASFLDVRYPHLHLVVVDNASTDGMAGQIRERFPAVELIRLQRNLGYCGGNNAGIEYALEKGAAYVLVVNPDTFVINPDFVTTLVDTGLQLPEAGIVGPLVDIYVRGHLQNTSCHLPFVRRKLRGLFTRRRPQRLARPTKLREVEVLNGVCILLRREMLLEIGAFDPMIFMYGDDWDMTIRAQARGWKSYQVPVDSIVHLQKKDGYDYLSMTNFLLKRNAAYVLLKHGYLFQAWSVAFGGLTLSVLRAMRTSYSRAGSVGYWRFVGRLICAYSATFLGYPNAPAFGPPAAEWVAVKKTKPCLKIKGPTACP